MATRTALLNGNVINRDADFSKHIEAVSEAGVISGLTVTSSSVAVGEAFVKCERTNGDVVYALVYNTEAQSISGDGDVYIEVSQSIIDNGELGNEDGSGIAEIKVGTMPSKNALKLATISSGTVTDKRNMIKKVGELKELIDANTSDIADLDSRVDELEEAAAIERLEVSGIVGELYTIDDVLFKQDTPSLSEAIKDYCNVGNTNDNKEIHIQRIASGVESNQLKLKIKSVGSPTTGLVVEVRKGIQVTVTANKEAYWYGDSDNIIATGSIAYGDISSSYAEITVTLDANFGGTKGDLLDVVVYQTGSVVNASNYYNIACSDGNYSEGFGFVSVNGSTRIRTKFIPYCVSVGVLDAMLCKAVSVSALQTDVQDNFYVSKNSRTQLASFSVPIDGRYGVKIKYNAPNISYLTLAIVQGSTHLSEITVNNVSGDVIIGEVDLTAGDSFTIEGIGGGTTGSSVGVYLDYELDIGLVPNEYKVRLQPLEVKSIGEFTSGTSHGVHNDGIFYGGVMLKKSGSATAGSITLGNAVGYIIVNFNGELIKIPYYNS